MDITLKKVGVVLGVTRRWGGRNGEALPGFHRSKAKRAYITNGASGDLTSYTDAENNKTTYSYNGTHGLVRLTDPLNRPALRNTFDEAGRLVEQVDAQGQTITYNYDLDSRKTVRTDRLSHPVTLLYDERGNVSQRIELAGGLPVITVYTHDSLDNLTSVLLPGNSSPTTYIYADSNNPRLLTRKVDPRGNAVDMTYEVGARLKTVMQASAEGGGPAQTTNFFYDSKGNLLSILDANGGTTSFNYHSTTGELISQTDAEGATSAYIRNQFGYVTSEIRAQGRPEQVTVSHTYDANGRRLNETKTTSAGTLTTAFSYDGNGRLRVTTYPDMTTAQRVYDSLGKVAFTRNQKGKETGFFYDASGRPTTVTFPDLTREVREYDAEGRLGARANRRGVQTLFGYDERGRQTEVTQAFGTTDQASTRREFDAMGRLVLEVDENGNRVKHEYDELGRRTRTIEGYLGSNPRETTFGYDGFGNRVSATDARGTVFTDYNSQNLPVTIRFPDGSRNILQYDRMGRQKVVITGEKGSDPGKRTEYDYDGLGRAKEVRQFDGGSIYTTVYGYDQAGNVVSVRDARGNQVTMEYDRMNRRVKRTLPGGQFEAWGYDATGTLTSYRDFNGVTTSYTIDPATDRVTAETRPDETVGYTYLATGVRRTKTDNTGTITYTYDARDRLIEEQMPDGTLDYVRDRVGNIRNTTSSLGNSQGVEFDALNRPTTVTDSFLDGAVWAYDGAGNVDAIAYPDQLRMAFGYNAASRMNQATITNFSTSVILANYGYSLNGAGLKTQEVEGVTGRQVDWVYDGLQRLTSEAITGDPNGLNGAVSYTWDGVGNRTSRTSTLPPSAGVTSQTFAGLYDTNDRLTAHTFDANGSTLAEGGRSYTYNSRRRITRVQGPGVDVGYLYDSDGNLVRRTDNLTGTVTRYLVDKANATGWAQTFEEIVNGQVKVRYSYGARLVSRAEFDGSQWSRRFYLYDGQGNVVGLSDEMGNVTDTYTYDSFGNLLSHTGTSANEFLYQGQRRDPATGLYFLRARWMHPDLGRFMTRDSFEGDMGDPTTLHRYLYANGNGVNFSDPSGMFSLPELSLSTAIIATLYANSFVTGLFAGAVIREDAAIWGVQAAWTKDYARGAAVAGFGGAIRYQIDSSKITVAGYGEAGIEPAGMVLRPKWSFKPELGVIFGTNEYSKTTYSLTAYWPIPWAAIPQFTNLLAKVAGPDKRGINRILLSLAKASGPLAGYGGSLGLESESNGNYLLVFPPSVRFGTVFTVTHEPDFINEPLQELISKVENYFLSKSLTPQSIQDDPLQLFDNAESLEQ